MAGAFEALSWCLIYEGKMFSEASNLRWMLIREDPIYSFTIFNGWFAVLMWIRL
jgi:hypothetical protein